MTKEKKGVLNLPSFDRDQLNRLANAVKALPAFTFPPLTYGLPQLKPLPIPSLPKAATQEELHRFESAADFLNRLAARIRGWRSQLPKDAQPVIFALLPNGVMLSVETFANDGHNAVVVGGKVQGTECLFMTHQTSLQLLCYIEKSAAPARKIGFRIGDEETQA